MKMKNILSLTLAATLAVSIALPVSAAQRGFSDMKPTHWAYTAVNEMAEKGYIKGVSGSVEEGSAQFDPDGTLTYGEFCTVIARAFYGDKLAEQPQSDDWWVAPMQALYTADRGEVMAKPVIFNTGLYDAMLEKNLITGGLGDYHIDGDAIFTADVVKMPITREDMAVIIFSMFLNSQVPMPDIFDMFDWGKANIPDYYDITHSYEVVSIYHMGILTGKENGIFDPNATLTRAELAMVLSRLCSTDIISEVSYGNLDANGNQIYEFDMVEKYKEPEPEYKSPESARIPDVVTPVAPGTYDTSIYTVPADTNKDGVITEAEVLTVFEQIKVEFPEDTPWGDEKEYYSPGFGMSGGGCAAFAFMVSDRIFGNLPARIQPADLEYTRDDIRVGDVIFMDIPHWNIVYDTSNDYMYFSVGGNVGQGSVGWGGGAGGVWGKTKPAVVSGFATFYTRYPQ